VALAAIASVDVACGRPVAAIATVPVRPPRLVRKAKKLSGLGRGRPTKGRVRARGLLLGKLAGGPVAEDEIEREVRAAALSRGDVLDASDDLELVCCRGQWRLPD
jgi:hypothetical protein